MKTKLSLILLASMGTGHLHALTLKESFEAARLNMETIKRADAFVQQTEEQKNRARAGVLPTISGVGTYTKIDPPESTGPSPFLLTRQYSYAIRLTQPLLRGGTLATYQLAKENMLLARYQKDASEVNLYQLVIAAYYNLGMAQTDVKNVAELKKFSQERVKEIAERTKIGRSRRGELVEAEAQAATAESQYQQSVITLKQAEQNFEFYTKLPPTEIIVSNDAPNFSGPLQEYTMKVKSRPDILATKQRARVAGQQVEIQKGGHYPNLDLISNYYFDRTGILATSNWDVGLAVTIPLFQGGGVQAGVREAVEAKRIAELTSDETTRAAERDVAINYQNTQQLQLQLKALKEALSKAEEAYKLNKKDYQNGLVTNLDVLQSLNSFIETKRTYSSLVAILQLNAKNLEASIGVLP